MLPGSGFDTDSCSIWRSLCEPKPLQEASIAQESLTLYSWALFSLLSLPCSDKNMINDQIICCLFNLGMFLFQKKNTAK